MTTFSKLQKKFICFFIATCVFMSSSCLLFAANKDFPRLLSVETITSDGYLDDLDLIGIIK